MSESVRGIDQLNRAFALAGGNFNREMKTRLRYFAQPVARDAELLAVGRIRRIGAEWSQMRTGATRHAGYVAPVKRGSRIAERKRRKFARLLLDQAMIPALDRNREQIARQFDTLLARLERDYDRR